MEASAPSLSVVIPVYRSAAILPELLRRLEPVLAAASSRYEILLVDDASPDESWPTIGKLAASHPGLRGISLGRNYGQHAALLAGLLEVRSDVVVTLDDDLQHPPEEIPKLLAKLAEGYDVVYGRPLEEQHGFLRDTASRITKLALQSAMGAEVARDVGAFRVFRARLIDAFREYRSPYVSIDVLLTWGTKRFAAVPVRHDPRRSGTSNYTFVKLVTHALNMATGFSVVPLRIASLVGFAFTAFGTGVLAYVLGRYFLEGGGVPGFPFLASVVAIFSGAQLFALGIIGEYLARMHFRMMGRPPFTVRAHTAGPAALRDAGDR
jgi:undecaprenyl-phosphate 4-deoxy-4-formamido-L-arabinose transferase